MFDKSGKRVCIVTVCIVTVCILTVYYLSNTTYINQKLLKFIISATCFSYNEPSSGQKWKIVVVHSVIVHLWDPIERTICSGTFSDCALYGIQ